MEKGKTRVPSLAYQEFLFHNKIYAKIEAFYMHICIARLNAVDL
jgi:hypothetical protein